MNILVIEDDIRLNAALEFVLRDAGLHVECLRDGEEGFYKARYGAYDIIILDILLPKKNGHEITTELRHLGVQTPILVLSELSSVADKIEAFDCGADDYMTKPFAPAELLAHLRALGRRVPKYEFETVSFSDLILNIESFELFCRDEVVQLSNKEAQILNLLMSNHGQLVRRERLIHKVWGDMANLQKNSIEAYMSFIRKKLAQLNTRVSIETVRMAGYRMVSKAEE